MECRKSISITGEWRVCTPNDQDKDDDDDGDDEMILNGLPLYSVE